MKRFLTSAFFATAMAFSFACGPYWMTPVDLKSLYNVTPSCNKDVNFYTSIYWTNYNEIGATESDLNKLIAEGSQAIETSVNPIAKALRQSGNKEDIEYFKILCDYHAKGSVDTQKMREYGDWYYPTKEEYKNWGEVKSKLLKKIEEYDGERLADRYAYTAMKIYFANMDLEGANNYINSHKKEFESLKESPLYEMCLSLYAGILFRSNGGSVKKAAEIYAEIGDLASLNYMGVFSDEVFDQIYSIWEEEKNSPILPYLLERAIARPSSTDKNLCDLANAAAKDPECKNPQMWKCASAAIHSNPNSKAYDVSTALKEIKEAKDLKGNAQSNQTMRVLTFYIKSLTQKEWSNDFANYALGEYNWIAGLGEKGNNALATITLEGIIPLLERCGKRNVAGLLSLRISPYEPYYVLDSKLNFSSNRYVEIMDADVTEKMFQKPSSPDKFVEWVYSSLESSIAEKQKEITEYIGTKYLREGNFSKAEEFLSKLDDTFCYDNRVYNVPRWFREENIINSYKNLDEWTDKDYSSALTAEQKNTLEEWGKLKNKKLQYCKDIQALIKAYEAESDSSSDEKYELAYKIAVLFDQASHSGYCWYLRQYERGSWRLPPPAKEAKWQGEEGGDLSLFYKRPFYFENEAKRYLALASESPNSELSYKAKYALLFLSYDDGDSKKIAGALRNELYEAQQQGLLSGEMARCDLLADYTANSWY
ncbi:MAG: hypothetical protein J5817_02320 [Treponema sp.]|nr:hypothetical protein [Treponema sp.]